MNRFVLLTDDQILLAGYHWPSKTCSLPRGVLLLLHGVAEHSGRYENLIEFYNKNNFAILTMDLRGHGQSDGKSLFIPTVEAIFQDIDLLIKKAKQLYPSLPFIFYGHSMGGNLALSYTLDRFPNKTDSCPYQGIVVTSPWIRLAGFYQPPRPIYSVIRAVCRIRPSLNVTLRFNTRKITRDTNVVDAYERDETIRRKATLSLARHIGGLAAKLDQNTDEFHIPVLVEHGQEDSITSHSASVRFAERGKNIDFKSWPNCFHELHSEPEKDEIFQYTLEWIVQNVLDK